MDLKLLPRNLKIWNEESGRPTRIDVGRVTLVACSRVSGYLLMYAAEPVLGLRRCQSLVKGAERDFMGNR